MEGTIQMTVNLRSPSVEYSGETGDNRYSRILRADMVTAQDVIDLNLSGLTSADDEANLKYFTNKLNDMAQQIGNLAYLTITKGGNKVTVHPDDISFITIEATGDFEKYNK